MTRKTVLARVLTSGLMLALSVTAHAQCGKERWPVKTLADKEGPSIAKSVPAKATVGGLLSNAAPTKADLLKAESTRFPAEQFSYQVEVLILGFKKESDSDYHIVITDPQNPGKTMISEIPSGSCAAGPFARTFTYLQMQFAEQVGKPTAKYRKLAKPVPATFIGLGFFDFLHGQTGVAANGIELHPLLKFEVHQ